MYILILPIAYCLLAGGFCSFTGDGFVDLSPQLQKTFRTSRSSCKLAEIIPDWNDVERLVAQCNPLLQACPWVINRQPI